MEKETIITQLEELVTKIKSYIEVSKQHKLHKKGKFEKLIQDYHAIGKMAISLRKKVIKGHVLPSQFISTPLSNFSITESDTLPSTKIQWSKISTKKSSLKKGQKISIYKLVKQNGWPVNKNTHSHIIPYLIKIAKAKNILIEDRGYLIIQEDTTLDIPQFESYLNYFKEESSEEFQEFYKTKLIKYNSSEKKESIKTTNTNYPNPIPIIKPLLNKQIASYQNPVTNEIEPMLFVDTFAGNQCRGILQLAIDFYDKNQTLKGFEYSLFYNLPKKEGALLSYIEQYQDNIDKYLALGRYGIKDLLKKPNKKVKL